MVILHWNTSSSVSDDLMLDREKHLVEYQMFNELTKRMQAIVRGDEKESVKDFMNSSLDPGIDYEN